MDGRPTLCRSRLLGPAVRLVITKSHVTSRDFALRYNRSSSSRMLCTGDDNGSHFLTRDPRDPLRFVDPLDP